MIIKMKKYEGGKMLLIVCFLFAISAFGQTVDLPLTERPPVIDGVISENEWDGAYRIESNFMQIRPDFGSPMQDKTIVHSFYDAENYYVLFEVKQDTLTFTEVKGTRDNAYAQDAVGFVVDPLGNKKELYMIIVGLSGNIGDFRKLRSNLDGSEDITWDGNIDASVMKTSDGYNVEMKIPFCTFRMGNSEDLVWNINFYRRIHSKGIQATYVGIEELSNDAEFEAMFPVVMKGIKTKGKIEITPYGIFGATVDSVVETSGDAGFDLKAPVNSSGVFNFAFNPDYSQIEGDPITFDNNIQYALYYSEYRPFFVEEKNVFATENEIYYSRAIQNPFVAGRYTHKDNSFQSGIIVAYDREDTLIGNTDAIASVARASKQISKIDIGLMALDRYDLSLDYNDLVLMQDFNFNISEGQSFSNLFVLHNTSNSAMNLNFENLKNNFMYKTQYFLFKDNWAYVVMLEGIGDSFKNDLGYVTWKGQHSSVGYIHREFRFSQSRLNGLTFSLQAVLGSDFDRVKEYFTSSPESLEYTIDAKVEAHYLNNGYAQINLRAAKAYWADTYFTAEKLITYMSMNITNKIAYDLSVNAGTRVDYNYLRVGYYSNGASNIYYTPFPFIKLNTGVSYDLFNADTSKYALSTKDVGEAVYQWKVVAADGGISFNPSNELSLKLIVQKQIARFAPDYYTSGEYMEKDEKLFLVCEYKPSVGNVIYVGGRYPENLLFFKFTHRFAL